MKRLIAVSLCVMLCFFTGCDLTLSTIDNLIKPPKLSEEQNRIDTALKASVGDNISLVYPKTGDYKSAFIVENIDEEETSEAIVFYKENSGSGTVRMNILDQQDEKWVSVWDNTTVNGSEIEKISFIKKDGRVYIVMGVNVTSANEKTLIIYEYTERVLKQVFTATCMNFEVYDLNDDGDEEIITISHTIISETKKENAAYMYSLKNGECTLLSQTAMDSEAASYAGIYKGRLAEDVPALYFDTQRGTDQYGTEILISVDNQLENPIQENKLGRKTLRYSGLSCMEDEDGVYSIPQTVILPGYSDQAVSEQPYLIAWYQYDMEKRELVEQATTYTNYSLGYSIRIPEEWLSGDAGQITAKRDTTNNELVFYVYHGDLKNESETLLKIRVFPRSSLVQGTDLPYGYTLLGTNGQMVYAYNLKRTHTDFDLTHQEVTQLFTIMQ